MNVKGAIVMIPPLIGCVFLGMLLLLRVFNYTMLHLTIYPSWIFHLPHHPLLLTLQVSHLLIPILLSILHLFSSSPYSTKVDESPSILEAPLLLLLLLLLSVLLHILSSMSILLSMLGCLVFTWFHLDS